MASAPTLAGRVVRWQLEHGRHDLPWQRTRDPYRVWLSEVMLQQTQVTTVRPYYERFVARFPSLERLAAAPLDEVFAAWSGLGYYGRARSLHRCAQVLVDQHGGCFPATRAGLEALPGIGRSTAAAIAAFCHGEREAVLDGNVKRVLTRVQGFDADLAQASAVRELWRRAEALLPAAAQIGAYTQGLMDLGAEVCRARRPRCEACPLAGVCVARRDGDPERYPVQSRRARRGRRRHALLWLEAGTRSWLVQRPPAGVWAGLLALPEFPARAELEAFVAGWPGCGRWLAPIEHALTHFDWTLEPLHWSVPAAAAARLEALLPAGRWVARTRAPALALPAPIRRLLAPTGAADRCSGG